MHPMDDAPNVKRPCIFHPFDNIGDQNYKCQHNNELIGKCNENWIKMKEISEMNDEIWKNFVLQ